VRVAGNQFVFRGRVPCFANSDPARAFGRSIRTDSSAITDSFAEAPDRLSSRIDAGPLTVIDSPTLIVIDRVFSAI